MSQLPSEQTEEQIAPAPAPTAHDPYAAFRSPAYRDFALAFTLAVLAQQMISTAVAWEVYGQTKSPLSLAWIGLAQALPILALALPAGHVADRFPRRRVMALMQAVIVLGSGTMAVLAYLGRLDSITVYAILLVDSVAATFMRPARASMMPALVPLGDFSNAVTWNSTLFETFSAVGPFIAGLIIAKLGVTTALGASVALLLVSLLLICRLPDYRTTSQKESLTLASLLAGVKFVFRTRLMLAAMTLDMFAVLLGGATFLLPIFAERLGVGATGYGWLRAAPPIGAIAMALMIAHAPPMKRAGRAMLVSVAGFGAATIVFGLSHNIFLSFAMLVLCGMCDNVSVVVRHTLVQTLTPDSMRGRVSAVNQVFIGSSNELGGLESGVTAALWGPVVSVVGGGIGTIAVVIGVALLFPQVRRLGALRDVKPEAEQRDRGFEVILKDAKDLPGA